MTPKLGGFKCDVPWSQFCC